MSSQERVFCHPCGARWNRNEHGLICPNCESEFVEIVSLHSIYSRSHQPEFPTSKSTMTSQPSHQSRRSTSTISSYHQVARSSSSPTNPRISNAIPNTIPHRSAEEVSLASYRRWLLACRIRRRHHNSPIERTPGHMHSPRPLETQG